MQSITVIIREKDKGGKKLSLFNLRDEVVNFLYRDTVAKSTKSDMQFYVLVYFAALRTNQISYLERIFDEGIPKFNDLIQAFKNRGSRLRAGEYRALEEEHGVLELFENDLFFVLAGAIINLESIESKFESFYESNEELREVLHRAQKKYRQPLIESFKQFRSSKIQDDRYDDMGNYHDLSKSVYRTIRMRNSRNLDLSLQKYTDVKEITSQSPVVVEFIQNIDPQIIIALWEKYHVAMYMSSAWNEFKDAPLATSSGLATLALTYKTWKNTNGRDNAKAKRRAKVDFEIAKAVNGPVLNELTMRLVESVLKSNETLNKEVQRLRQRLSDLQDRAITADKDEINKLKARITALENLEVNAELTKGEDSPKK